MRLPILGVAVVASLFLAAVASGHGPARPADRGGAADHHDTGFGEPGDPGGITRTVTVEMNDGMRFVPAEIRVERGETIRFLVRNVGAMRHEMVIGTLEELKRHAELMKKFPEMEHADPNQVVVDPGKAGEVIWHFTKAGTFDIACLQPGHFEAGMVGKVVVASNEARESPVPGGGFRNGTGGGENDEAMTPGVVRKVDRKAGKVTLSHEAIRNLGMPKMTMIFRVGDAAMLDRLKEGDRILFFADRVDGSFTVLRFRPAPEP